MIGSKRIKALKVIGEPLVQVENLQGQVFLDEEAHSILEIRLHPADIHFNVFRHKVIVQGTLLANIIYKAVNGSVLHQGLELPFHEEVGVPGLVAGVGLGHKTIIPAVDPFAVDIQIYVTELTSDFVFNELENEVFFKVLFKFILKVCRIEQMGVFVNGAQGIFSFRGDRSVRL